MNQASKALFSYLFLGGRLEEMSTSLNTRRSPLNCKGGGGRETAVKVIRTLEQVAERWWSLHPQPQNLTAHSPEQPALAWTRQSPEVPSTLNPAVIKCIIFGEIWLSI